jgi:gas vesicle protein
MHDSLRLRAVSFPFLKDLSGSAADGKSAGLKVDVIKGAATPERTLQKKGVMIMKERFLNRAGSMVVPILAGGFVGAGTALLLAPKPGIRVRKDLKRIANITRDQVSEAVDKGREIYEESRTAVANAVEAGKKTYVEGIEKLEKFTKKDERSVLLPMLAGGVIGAGIALLLAPKSGMEVREDLKRLAASTKDRVSSAVEKGKVLYGEGRTAVTNAMEEGKKVYTEGIEKLRQAVA